MLVHVQVLSARLWWDKTGGSLMTRKGKFGKAEKSQSSSNIHFLSQSDGLTLCRKVERSGLFFATIVLSLLLTACGGGGSDPVPETNTNCVLGSSTIGDCKI